MNTTTERNATQQDNSTSAAEERIKTFIAIQLGQSAEGLSLREKKEKLSSKFKKVLVMMLLNFGFVVFFSISFYYDITQLSTLWFNLIIVFFIINVLFYAYQRKQLKEATSWIDSKLAENNDM
ncbi:MAG: hypothetical protein LAT84_13675 [Balneolia bacterium]|nr:hypothetical protein [Balneolia bacterium]